MSYFDLNPVGAESARQNAFLNPINPGDMGPGFWSGSGKGLGLGLAQSGAQAAMALADISTPALMPGAKKIDDLFGGSNAQDWLKTEQMKTHTAVKSLMPGPDVGLLGQIGYGAGTIVPQAVAGTLATGTPIGGAALVSTLQGYATKIEAEDKGVDPETATLQGLISGGAAGLGVLLPAGFGVGYGQKIATGVAANVSLGAAERGSVSALLESRGYDELAKQYKAFDATSILTDAVLGVAFGGFEAYRAGKVAPTLADEALASNKQQHLEVSTAPGIPDGPQSRSLHGKAIDKAMRDVMGDQPVDVSATGIDNAAFVPNRAVQEARVEAALAQETPLRTVLAEVDELRQRAEALGLTPADEVLFEGKKLVDPVRDQVEASGARDLPGAVHGRDGEVFLGDRREPVRFVLVEADALAATISKSDNQFRDRTRAASQQQITKIANDLQFGRLGEAPTMAEGAPTVAQDGTIVGGNGRVAAVQQAYSRGLGEGYRVALEQRAGEFGLTAGQVQGFTRPVLVRQFTNPVDVRTAAILSNESAGLRMSALEQAKVDAERMPVMPELPESGDLGAASLRGFVSQWLSRYPQGELGEFVTADGKLSPQGEKRLQNAVLFKAYGDTPTLARLVEATDDLSRNLTGALVKSAANVAEARDLIAAGELHDLDIQPQLLQAVDVTQRLRAEGTKFDDWLAQEDMFGTGVGPEAVLLMQHFKANARSQKAMVAALTGYYDAVRALGDPRQANMFDAPPPARGEILRAVLEGRAVAPEVTRAAAPAVTFDDDLLGIAAKESKAAPAILLSDIEADAQGIIPGKARQLDRSIGLGKITEAEVAQAWAGTREMLRQRYGDTITLYRADAPVERHSADTRTVYMADEATAGFFANRGRTVQAFQVPVDDVLAIYAKPSGYYEAIVRKPGGDKTPAGPTITPAAAFRQGERAAAPEMQRLDATNQAVLLDLFGKAEAEKAGFDQSVADLAAEFNGAAKLAPLKGVDRAVDKIAVDYAGDASRIGDLLRATVEVDSAESAARVAAKIEADYEVVGNPRNLFAPDAVTVDGYRDAKFNVLINGVKAELQVNIPEMLAAKKAVHGLYKERTAVEREAGWGNKATPEQQGRIDRLNAAMRSAYDAAFEAASRRAALTNAAKSSGETGAPLSRAESGEKGRGGSTSQATQYPASGKPSDTGTPSTSKSAAPGGSDFSSKSMEASGSSVPLGEKNTMSGTTVRQVLDDMPNAQVLDEMGELQPAALSLEQSDAKIAMTEADAPGIEAAAACALR